MFIFWLTKAVRKQKEDLDVLAGIPVLTEAEFLQVLKVLWWFDLGWLWEAPQPHSCSSLSSD